MRASKSRAVYYTVNSNPFYLFCAKKSIESLRKFNQSIDVHIFISLEDPSHRVRSELFEKHGAKVWIVDKTKMGYPADGFFERYFFKWLALKDLNYERLLFVDADTAFFQDVVILFEKLDRFDFYAREENGTAPDKSAYLIGSKLIPLQIYRQILSQVISTLKLRPIPIFNTGVMLLNNRLQEEISTKLATFHAIYQDIETNRLPYPSTNPHIKDEIVASLVFGGMPKLTCGFIDKELSPWYVEFKAGVVKNPGVVMHTWSEYFPFYLQDFEKDDRLISRVPGFICDGDCEILRDLMTVTPPPQETPIVHDAAAVPGDKLKSAEGTRPPVSNSPLQWFARGLMRIQEIPRLLFPSKSIAARNFYWEGLESASGPGSDLRHTMAIRRAIPALLKELNVRSLLDAGCGDFHWMREMPMDLDSYIGVDFNPGVIAIEKAKYANSRRDFYCLDITRDALPRVDLVLCRDLLMLLPYADIFSALRNLKKTGSTYLLTTTYQSRSGNADVPVGGWFPIDLQSAPFNFLPPIQLIDEGNAVAFGEEYAGKSLGLWKLGDIF